MKRFLVLVSFILSIFLAGCNILRMNGELKSQISKEVYYSMQGYSCELSENYLVYTSEAGLNVFDLNKKQVIKEIKLPYYVVGGYDISGTKIVWSMYSSEEELGKDYFYDETTNTDVYIYDIVDDSTLQITTNTKGQTEPKIFGDYIVWQDNRNDTVNDMIPEWDIYLYKISTKEEKLITTAPGIHTNPSINEDIIAWEDGRNFSGDIVHRWGSNVPENNTDIYMYNITTGEEKAIATGPLQESAPSIYGNYIVWEDRNNKSQAADIYLYDIDKNKKIQITKDKFNQAYPKIFGKYIVWMDERNGNSSNDVFINGKGPNSDIFLYDIEEKRETLMTGEEPQIMPFISENYIAYVTSRQVNPIIEIIKYR